MRLHAGHELVVGDGRDDGVRLARGFQQVGDGAAPVVGDALPALVVHVVGDGGLADLP